MSKSARVSHRSRRTSTSTATFAGLSRNRLLAYLLLLINVVVWGASMTVVKPSFEFTSPFRFLFYRFTIASFLTLPLFFYYWPKIKHKIRVITLITLIELLGNTVVLGLLYLGLERMGAIETSLITGTTPIFIIVAGVVFLKEVEEKREWIGLLLAVIGTFLLILLPAFTGEKSLHEFSVLGIFFLVSQNITNTAWTVLAKKYYTTLPKLFVASVSFLTGMISFGLLSWWQVGASFEGLQQAFWSDFSSPIVVFAVMYMSILGSVLSLTVLFKALELIEASEATLFNYLHPLVYVPLGILLLNESFSVWQGAALAMVLVGVLVSEFRWPRYTHHLHKR